MYPTRILFFKLNIPDPFDYSVNYNFWILHHLRAQHPSKSLVPRAEQTFLLAWYPIGCECYYTVSMWISWEDVWHEPLKSWWSRVLQPHDLVNTIIKEMTLILDALFLVNPCCLPVILTLCSRYLIKCTSSWFQVAIVNIKYLLLVSEIHFCHFWFTGRLLRPPITLS